MKKIFISIFIIAAITYGYAQPATITITKSQLKDKIMAAGDLTHVVAVVGGEAAEE